MAAVYAGGRPYAWLLLAAYWAVGAAAGSLGYWKLLQETALTLPALHVSSGGYAVVFAVGAIAFLRIPLYLGAFRMGRPLSSLSLILFPLANAVLEGFSLLFMFDAGRWILSEESWQVKPGTVGFAALTELPSEDRRVWREFLFGFAPYTVGYVAMYACVWEEHILPAHLDLETPNKFVRAMVMVNMALIAVYWLYADVATYTLLRLLNETLLVLCVRLPPPGAKLAPAIHPSDLQAAPTGGPSTPQRREKKKN
ncbi:hypothetical protein ACKKBF_B39030 [Auxenochlorella protothecoides x Auxenochlorella symbiontica]|uniref:Uncharacterized protein n=1 Tax=Auxenochlorella protothecoides TaxID=3075 RepID=A0A1D1ZUZ3_AUXPR|nr:hypothetical protein APUTEX25_000514 [Auxenochlorella protothecoides]|eukprot:RMZ54997.1 hypothetical protein APUTEX25_000514 [Auxenochlorella protothecoides]